MFTSFPLFLRFSLFYVLLNGFLSLSYAETIPPQEQPLQGQFAVIPLQNKTANAELDWLAIALQESLTIDLWYLPVGATETLVQYSNVLNKYCPKMALSCVQQQTLNDWQGLAKEKGYTHLIWGSYQANESNHLTIQLQLINAATGMVLADTSFSSDNDHITEHSGAALLTLLKKQGLSASKAQQKRVLYPETNQAAALKANALGYWTQQQYAFAGKKEQKALAPTWQQYLQQAINVENGYANAWSNLGWYFSITDKKNNKKKKQAFSTALKANADHPDAIDGLGEAYKNEKNYVQAERLLKTLPEIGRSMSHRYMTLITVYQAMKKNKKVLVLLEKQLILSSTIDDISDLTRLGLIHYQQSNYLRALPLFQRIVSIREQQLGKNNTSTLTSLNTLALLHKRMGSYNKAEFLYQRVFKGFEQQEGKTHLSTAASLNNLAGLYRDIGAYSKAESGFQRALAIFEKQSEGDSLNIATCLNNLAGLYRLMGAYNKAKPLYKRALAIKKKQLGLENSDTATVFNNLAVVYHKLKEYNKAKDLYQYALEIREKTLGKEHLSVATSLNNIALLYYDMGIYDEIEPLYQRALSIIKKKLGEEHPSIAIGLNNLAGFYQMTGAYNKAEPLYQEALTIRVKKLGTKHPLTAASLSNLANLYYSINTHSIQTQKPSTTIIFLAKHAINILQSSRQKNLKLSKLLKSSFIGSKETMYRALVTWLLKQNRLQEAEHVMAMYKEKEVADYYKKEGSTKNNRLATLIDFTVEEQPWNERYKKMTDALYTTNNAYTKLNEKDANELSPKEQQQVKQLEKNLAKNTVEFQQFLHDIRQPWAKPSVNPIQQKSPDALQKTLSQLGKGVVIVNYFVAEDKLHILLTTSTTRILRESPVSAKDLGNLIKNYRIKLKQTETIRGLSQTLHKHLIAPIAADLKQANANTLMLSLDQTLRYLPMAALHDGDSYLIERYKLSVYTPAVGYQALITAANKKASEKRQIIAMGVTKEAIIPPLLSGEESYSFSALPYVTNEIKGIVKSKASSGFINGHMYLNKDAKKEVLINALSENPFSIIHLATHFQLNKGNGYQSFLLLGEQTTLPIAELYRHPAVDFKAVDLLTVSACNTGMLNAQSDGSEVESFAAIAQQKGAKAVLASLWAVNDRSTSQLMQTFYRHWKQGTSESSGKLKKPVSKLVALQKAQLHFVQQGKHVAESDCPAIQLPGMPLCTDRVSYPEQSHPYYWAPFVLMGNWL